MAGDRYYVVWQDDQPENEPHERECYGPCESRAVAEGVAMRLSRPYGDIAEVRPGVTHPESPDPHGKAAARQVVRDALHEMTVALESGRPLGPDVLGALRERIEDALQRLG